MRADNEFLLALSEKLIEIADECVDLETKEQLYNLSDQAVETAFNQIGH